MGTVLRPSDRVRRTRNRPGYPSFTTVDVTPGNVRADLPAATAIVQAGASVPDGMSPAEGHPLAGEG